MPELSDHGEPLTSAPLSVVSSGHKDRECCLFSDLGAPAAAASVSGAVAGAVQSSSSLLCPCMLIFKLLLLVLFKSNQCFLSCCIRMHYNSNYVCHETASGMFALYKFGATSVLKRKTTILVKKKND